MNYESFKKEIQEKIKEYLPEDKKDWKITMKQVQKVNAALDGLVLMPPEEKKEPWEAGLTFYMEDYYRLYQNGASIEQLMREIGKLAQECAPPPHMMDAIAHPEKIRNQVMMELVNKKRNRKLLKKLPHRDILDLAVVYRLMIKDEKTGFYCTHIDKSLMGQMNLTEEELFQNACNYMMKEAPFGIQNFEGRVVLVSNTRQMFGASVILFPEVLDGICKELGGNLYIIPASADVICVVKEDPEILPGIIKRQYKIYHQGGDPDDLISDRIYFYRRNSGCLEYAEKSEWESKGGGLLS